MIPILRALWAEIVTPSKPDEPAYTVMLIAIAHAVLGASLAAIDLGAALAVTRAAIPLAYWLIKERADLRQGGRVLDSLIDTAFVTLGAFYAGQAWWPAVVLASALVVSILFTARRSA